MPLVQRRLSQNIQFTWVTHLFLKLALDVDIFCPAKMDEHSRLSSLQKKAQQKNKGSDIDAAHYQSNLDDRLRFYVDSAVVTLIRTPLYKR